MNSLHLNRRQFGKSALGAVLLLAICSALPAFGQSPKSGKPVIVIDGSLEPERIPDWILWRELFNGALMLADKAPDSGCEFWQTRLGLSQSQVNQLISHGRALREHEKKINANAKELDEKKDKVPPGALTSQLHQMQADRESRVLQIRDELKDRIGTHAFLRLQSYLRLNIARNVKVRVPSSRDK